MYKKILVPVDGSDLSKKAVSSAAKFASEIGASIVFCNVINSSPFFYYGIGAIFSAESIGLYKEHLLSVSKDILTEAHDVALQDGVNSEMVSLDNEEIYQGIIQSAKAKNCDLIFMASHGYSDAQSLLLGGQTSKVLAHSPIPVLVNR